MWLQETPDNSAQTSDDKWLKIPDPEVVGKSAEVTIRVLESVPEDTWRHWLENRVFNCPGIDACSVCRVRNAALKQASNEQEKKAVQNQYRTDHRFFFNVLHEGKVKVFSFGSGVSKQLRIFDEKYEDKYGNITSYDVTVMKRKTGKLPQNVEYTVVPEIPPRELTETELGVVEARYDLKTLVVPASREDLLQVAQGEMPAATPKTERATGLQSGPQKATLADIMLLKALVEAKDLELSHFGFVDGEEIDKVVVEKLIADLQKNK